MEQKNLFTHEFLLRRVPREAIQNATKIIGDHRYSDINHIGAENFKKFAATLLRDEAIFHEVDTAKSLLIGKNTR